MRGCAAEFHAVSNYSSAWCGSPAEFHVVSNYSSAPCGSPAEFHVASNYSPARWDPGLSGTVCPPCGLFDCWTNKLLGARWFNVPE